MRVTRVLRLAGKYKGLQSLLKTIVMSVDSLFNVFILLMLIFFIMAVLGNTMFFAVTEGNVISSYKNFNNFHQSFSLLFSISTGEDWNRIMFDCWRGPPECVPGKTCGSSLAPLFFLLFILIVSNIMLNLFILVIIQQFSKYYLEDDNPLSRFEEDFEDFKEAWKVFTDRYQCIKIKTKQIKPFFMKLPLRIQHKLNIGENATEGDIDKLVLKMGINVDDGFVYFNEMLYRIMRMQFMVNQGVRLNSVMTINELVVQFKIAEITMQEKTARKLSQESREKAFFETHTAQPVNLFLTKMYFKASFLSWLNFADRLQRKEEWD